MLKTKNYNLLIIKHLYESLKPIQKRMFAMFLSVSNSRKYVVHCSRRLGKTYLLCVLAIVFALSKSNAQIRYASVTQKSVRKMIKPIFKKIFASYKVEFRPKWNNLEGAYIFSNGSMVHVAGVNNGHEDDLRGTDADLAIVDEGAFIDNLSYLVESVLVPQLINTGGKLVMSSSSPLSPAHEFAGYIQQAKIGGYYSDFDIYKAGYPDDIVAEFCKEAGGAESTTWRREYLNELIVDTEFAIIPEFDGCDYARGLVSEFYDILHKYNSMDLGVRDLNVNLFAHYDFPKAELVIERELVISGPQMTTPLLHQAISEIEQELWQGAEPYKRVADNNNPLLLLDLGAIHNMYFNSTSKDSLHAMVNQVRVWIAQGRVKIDPSCVYLIESLKYGVWNNNRSEFARSKALGHYDAIAALMYLIRNIDETTNPIPIRVGFDQVNFEDDIMEGFKMLRGNRV
jgi:hypothetical protein